MGSCNKTSSLLLAAALTVTATGVNAQTAVPVDGIQKQLSQLFQTAKATADGTDLVTAGAVLVLQKDHLMMDKVDQPIPTPNLYTKGGISNGGMAGAVNFFKAFSRLGGVIPGAPGAPQGLAAAADASREFVAGEKFFVTRIDTRTDGVTFSLMSDPIKDVRYHATLKFPFARGTVPSPDDVAAQVSEVVKVDDTSQDQSAGNQGNDKGGDKAGAAPAETKTIAIGQTRDQVVAMFGVPSKIVQFGAKEIDTFPDMKVTFVQNKVVDVK